MTNTMKNQEIQAPIYDERVNATIKGLMEGKTRGALAEEFSLGGWKSLDIYMRRKGFAWDGANSTYIPATNKADKILEELGSSAPIKAEMIIKRFEEMGDDNDPRAIAKEFGFKDHRELGEYMESKHLFWDSEKKNYRMMVGDSSDDAMEDISTVDDKTIQRAVIQRTGTGAADLESSMELEAYRPILDLLIQNKDRLLTLLMPESTGTIPRYTVPGTPKTQSLYMSDLLARVLKEFSESKNLKQREVVEGALIEYFKRYGYQREMNKLISNS